MGRKEQFPVKKMLGFDQQLLDRIDAYRRKQTPIPNLSDAIRDLLDQALLEQGIA
jgi:hypothetical protein